MHQKGFTLIELLAVILILAIIATISIPIIVNIIESVQKEAYKQTILGVIHAAELENAKNKQHISYIVENGSLYTIDDTLIKINTSKEINGIGAITLTNGRDYTVEVCDAKWCAVKKFEDDTVEVYKREDYLTSDTYAAIALSSSEVDTSEEYTVTILNYSIKTIDLSNTKYIINRIDWEIGTDSVEWDTASNFTERYMKLTVDSNEPGVFYVHVLTTDTEGNKKETISPLIHVKINDLQRTKELIEYKNTIVGSPTTTVSTKYDIVEPWLYEVSPKSEIIRDFKLIKRGGYQGVILNHVMNIRGGTAIKPIKINEVWYDTNLTSYKDVNTITYKDVVSNIMSAAEIVGLKVYLGVSLNEDWWDENNQKDLTWINNNSNFTNLIIDDLYTKFQSSSAFAGWYWTNEMYTNNSGYETNWSTMINSNITNINSKTNQYPLIVNTFISTYDIVDPSVVQAKWTQFMANTNFRNNDVFLMDDGLGTTEFTVAKVGDYIKALKVAVDSKASVDVKFNLITSNFSASDSNIAIINRFKEQLNVASYFGDNLYSSSYIHNYGEFNCNGYCNPESGSYDKEYRNFIGLNTSNDTPIYGIAVPTEGSVYVDSNYDEAPIPAGFTVSDNPNERIISDGLVIRDNQGNEFVWVPVNYGVKADNYKYNDDESSMVAYTRYHDNGITISSVNSGAMPIGVTNETDQILKYYGFYIARYEASYFYNGADPKVQIKAVSDSHALPNFNWSTAIDSSANDNLWVRINYNDAMYKSELMASHYSYHNSVKTGLVTGRQFDTALRWIDINSESGDLSFNGTTWGNYTDSIGDAATGNYSSGIMRGTGSNDAWKKQNIYDLAGNLREWTNETNNSSQFSLRSNAYNANGYYGSPSYGILTEAYSWDNTGFRVVLYIQ